VFGKDRDLLEMMHGYMEFFEEESCGYCTPCRVGNVLLKDGLKRLMEGRAEPADLEQFRELGKTMKATSRCGLGQTSWRPVVTAFDAFPDLFTGKVVEDADGFRRSFDLKAEVSQAEGIAGRESEHAGSKGGDDER